ncbi:MAG: GNAT family N-acetyltransferase [Zhenhengia sp.]
MKDILISDFTNPYFEVAFKRYFAELDIKVTNWDKLFEEMNKDQGNHAFVRLTKTDDVVGFIQFKPIELTNWFFCIKMGFIREFWIAKEFRNTGNGSDLLHLAETYFIEHTIYKSILTADTASLFYETRGYKKENHIVAENKDDVYIKNLK